MAIYYLKTVSGDIYYLDCTESFSFSEGGSLTEYTIESGAKASDHYVNENKSISLSGIITDYKSSSSVNKKSSGDFIGGLLKIKSDKTPVTLYYREQPSSSLDNMFKDLMFTNITFSQDTVFGYSLNKHAYKVDMQLKQIVYSERATVSMESVISAKAAPKKETTASTTNVNIDLAANESKREQEKLNEDNKRLREQISISTPPKYLFQKVNR